MYGPELKLIDVNASATDVTLAGTWQLLNGTSTGTDYQLRIGRKIRVKSIQLRGYLRPTDPTTVVPQRWDLYVIYDKQSDGSAPTTTAFLENSTAVSFTNLNNRRRFMVLGHICGYLGSNGANGALAPGGEAIDWGAAVDLETIYNGTGGTIADIATGSIYLLSISSTTSGTGTGFTTDMVGRVRFTDE